MAAVAMLDRSVSKLAQADVKGGSAHRVMRTVIGKAGLGRARDYAARLAGALPAFLTAPPGERAWQSALIGPARYPDGYRDALILTAGRLLPTVVRQNGRGGNLHEDPAAEIGRVAGAYAHKERPHKDRLLRQFVPAVSVDAVWLREAARRHDVPMNPTLATALLKEIGESGASAKSAFRATLDPEVAELLRADDELERFHDWLADHRIDAAIRMRRRTAFQNLRGGCEHIRSRNTFAMRLDAGEDPFVLLGEILDADPAAIRKLAQRRNDPLRSLEEAERKAWALELMPKEILAELKGDLNVAGGWAARAMSFGRIVADDPKARREAARRLLGRPGLRQFVDYPKTFLDWAAEEGEREIREMLTAVVRFTLLPAIMNEADQGLRQAPTPVEIATGVREFARVLSTSLGIKEVEIARLEWRKLISWLPKNLIAICHPSFEAWPPMIAPFKGVHAHIDCLASLKALEEEFERFNAGPAILYDVLFEGAHVLRLRDDNGTMIALTIVRQAELEAAQRRGRVDGADIERDGWAAKPQWKRLMHVEIARIIDQIARRGHAAGCDLAGLRREIDGRTRVAAEIAARPCGFAHENAAARTLAKSALEGVTNLILHKPQRLAHHLFGPPRNPSLEADAAFLNGTPLPAPPPKVAVRTAPKRGKTEISPLLLPLPAHTPVAPAEYNPSAAAGRIRRCIVKGKPLVPEDPLRARFVVIDVETTGLGVRDRIIEISAIELLGPDPTGDNFHSLVKTETAISDGAFAVHGIAESTLQDEPTFAEIADPLVEFLAKPGSWFVAHNAEFDVGFINRELERAGRKFRIPTRRVVCTLAMAGSSLDEVCDGLHINRSSRTKHRAQMDAELCAEVFRQIVFGKRRMRAA